MVQHRVHERARFVAWRGVHHHARRLQTTQIEECGEGPVRDRLRPRKHGGECNVCCVLEQPWAVPLQRLATLLMIMRWSSSKTMSSGISCDWNGSLFTRTQLRVESKSTCCRQARANLRIGRSHIATHSQRSSTHLRDGFRHRRRRQPADDHIARPHDLAVLDVHAAIDLDQAQLDAVLQLRAADIRQLRCQVGVQAQLRLSARQHGQNMTIPRAAVGGVTSQ